MNNNQLKIQQDQLFDIENRIEKLKKRAAELRELEKTDAANSYKHFQEKSNAYTEIRAFEKIKLNQKNKVIALENNGTITSITDKKGKTHENIPDFRNVNTENISFSEDNILVDKQPPYIPFIDEDNFRQRGYVFDAIRIDKDSYLIAISSHKETIASEYVITTLDQLVLIVDYYTTKAKANNIKEAVEQTQRQEKYWDNLPETRRERFLMQRNIYLSLPVKTKKEITKEEYEKLTWQEREKIYKFYKRYGSKRITSKLGSNEMWTSFHDMYERFVNPQAVKPAPRVGNKEVFAYWFEFVEMINYKLNDINIQRADLSETYRVALETSFGEINTSDVLKAKYGILVKRQNGDQIKPIEINQIEEAIVAVQNKFGNLKQLFLKENIKISHTGVRLVFASKAMGMWVPQKGTIAISDKHGNEQFQLTASHEIAHFIDYYIGHLSSKRYATDNYESIAGKIAYNFRKNMNVSSSKQTKYTNSTKECFARAMEMYFGIETFGEQTGVSYSDGVGMIIDAQPFFAMPNFVNRAYYYANLKPLIEHFFTEQKDVFVYTQDINQSEEPIPIGTETTNDVEQEIIKLQNLILKDTTINPRNKQQMQEAIEVLQMLEGKEQTIKVQPTVMEEETYLSINGASRQDIGDSAFHKNKGNNSDKTWSKMVNAQAEKDRKLIAKREELRKEYWLKVAQGELRPPTRNEKLISTANGNPDNESVIAARRLLEKRNINWKQP